MTLVSILANRLCEIYTFSTCLFVMPLDCEFSQKTNRNQFGQILQFTGEPVNNAFVPSLVFEAKMDFD